MRVLVGSDHAGFSLRRKLLKRLQDRGIPVVDVGPDSDSACDYPEYASVVASAVRGDPSSVGILVCATGQGMAIAAGKVRGIRAVVPATVEAARLSRFDNNANVLCLAGRLLKDEEAFAIVDTWLATGFAGGRHARRIAKVAAIETASAVAFITESERLRLTERGVPRRIFDQEPSLFDSPDAPASELERIRIALRWLALPDEMAGKTDEITEFVRSVRRSLLKNLIVLSEQGEGAPTVALARACDARGVRIHSVEARQLASHREELATLRECARQESSLVLVSSGAGTSRAMEVAEGLLWSMYMDHCLGDANKAGAHFAAITHDGDPLVELAEIHRYRKIFRDPNGIPPDFRAIGYGGLVPLVLLGLDPARTIACTRAMVDSCRRECFENNPAVSLGMLLGALAKHGRGKLTLLPSKSLLPLRPWIGSMVAGFTPPDGRGLVVQPEEALLAAYPPDRIFVHLQAQDDSPALSSEQVESLHLGGHPYIQMGVSERHELLAEVFRWQMAVAVAAIVMGARWTLPAEPPPQGSSTESPRDHEPSTRWPAVTS